MEMIIIASGPERWAMPGGTITTAFRAALKAAPEKIIPRTKDIRGPAAMKAMTTRATLPPAGAAVMAQARAAAAAITTLPTAAAAVTMTAAMAEKVIMAASMREVMRSPTAASLVMIIQVP